MKTPTILLNRCYSEITPESAEQGDTSDTGFVFEREAYTFSELVSLIKSKGFDYTESLYRAGEFNCFTTGFQTEDFRTGTEREETLHFCRENPKRLLKWFWLALRTVKDKRAR